MEVFEYGISIAEKDLTRLRVANPPDSDLRVFGLNSIDHLFFGAQLGQILSYCILPRGHGIGEAPMTRILRAKLEAGELK